MDDGSAKTAATNSVRNDLPIGREDILDALRALARTAVIQESFYLRCAICYGRGEIDRKNIVHKEDCWTRRAAELLESLSA